MSDRASAVTSVPSLVGRAGQLESLARHAAAARAGRPRLVLVDGPAGVGRTALLQAAADGPFAGMTVLYGGCRAAEAATDYSGVRALYGRLGLTSRKGRTSPLLDGGARRALAALVTDPEDPDHPGAAPDTFSVLQGLYRLAVNLMASGPLVLVLDDAHWCDERSLHWLDFLLRRADGLPLLVVAAHRTEAGAAGPEALAGLAAHHLPESLRLGPLDASEVAELTAGHLPGDRPEPAFVGRLVSVTGGNPLAVVRLLGELRSAGLGPDEEGARHITEAAGQVVATTVHGVLAGRPGWVREVLLALAVLGAEDTAHLAALAGLSTLHVEEGVEILGRAGLVRMGRREPVHELVRAAVLDQLDAAGAARLRLRAARLLSDIGRCPEETAVQLLAVPGPGDAWTTSVLRAAAARAEQRGAAEAAARYLERVREADPDDPDVPARLGKALAETDPKRAVGLLQEAHARTTDVRARAATAVRLALTCLSVQRSPDGARVLTRALADLDRELGSDPEPADRELRTLAESALLIVGADEKSTLPDVLRRTAGLAPPPGDTPAQRQQLAMLGVLAAVDGRHPAAESVRRARRAVRAPGVPLGPSSLLPASLALSLADENRAADAAVETVLRGSRDTAAVRTYGLALATRSLYRLENGAVADALADAQSSLEILGEDRGDDSAVRPYTAYAAALAERGEAARAEDSLVAVRRPRLERFVWEYHWYLMARGRVRAVAGDPEGALEAYRTCGDSLDAAGLRNPVFAPWWLEAACLLGGLGRVAEAREAAAHGAPLAERWGTPRALGYAALARGAATPGPAGMALLREAVALLEGSPARAQHARALLLLGRATLAGGSVREARGHLREAVALARRGGCVALAREAREDLVEAGGRMREITASPLDMLTGTERTVAGLVASGAGNREVAESLFVTVRTVELHLTSVYRKLGVGRRRDLTETLRAGGPPPVLSRVSG